HSAKIARSRGGQDQGAYRRPNAVRTDHEIVVSGRAVGEPDRDATIVLHHRYDRCAEPAAQIGDTRQQRSLQRVPFDSDARTCIAPQRLEIGFRPHLPLLVAELPAANDRSRIRDAGGEAERTQHAHAVGLDEEPCSQSVPSLLPLDELRPEAAPMKGGCRGETGDPPPTTRTASIFAIFPPIAAHGIDIVPFGGGYPDREAPILDRTEQRLGPK